MVISNLENVKKEIQITRKGEFAAWIYKDGKLADNILLVDTLEVIEAFEKNVINLDNMPAEEQEKLIDFICNNAEVNGNTYNCNGKITNDMNYNIVKIGNYYYAVIMFLLGGDIRGRYTDYLLLKFEDVDDFFSINGKYGFDKVINNEYYADIDIFSNTYEVRSRVEGIYIGEFYEVETGELLKQIKRGIKNGSSRKEQLC